MATGLSTWIMRYCLLQVYEHVLQCFEQLMNERQDFNDKLWCNLIGYKANTLIIFEDLLVCSSCIFLLFIKFVLICSMENNRIQIFRHKIL